MCDIEVAVSLSQNEIIVEIIALIRSGFNITKVHLMHLVDATEDIFDYVKSHVTEEDFYSLDNIDEIKDKFCRKTTITEQMLTLILNYLKIRQYLKVLRIPYYDPDEKKLINANVLLGENGTLENESSGTEKTNSAGIEHNSDTSSAMLSNAIDNEVKVMRSNCESPVEIEAHKVQSIPSTSSITASRSNVAGNTSIIARPPLKMVASGLKRPASQTNSTSSSQATKRVTVKPVSKVVYCSDSDSDDENSSQPPNGKQITRSLPHWLSANKRHKNY